MFARSPVVEQVSLGKFGVSDARSTLDFLLIWYAATAQVLDQEPLLGSVRRVSRCRDFLLFLSSPLELVVD